MKTNGQKSSLNEMRRRAKILVGISICSLIFLGMATSAQSGKVIGMSSTKDNFTSGYSNVNGIRMYYEIHGEGQPLVLIHGGGSTIGTSFGRLLPIISKQFKVIAVACRRMAVQRIETLPKVLSRMPTTLPPFYTI